MKCCGYGSRLLIMWFTLLYSAYTGKNQVRLTMLGCDKLSSLFWHKIVACEVFDKTGEPDSHSQASNPSIQRTSSERRTPSERRMRPESHNLPDPNSGPERRLRLRLRPRPRSLPARSSCRPWRRNWPTSPCPTRRRCRQNQNPNLPKNDGLKRPVENVINLFLLLLTLLQNVLECLSLANLNSQV